MRGLVNHKAGYYALRGFCYTPRPGPAREWGRAGECASGLGRERGEGGGVQALVVSLFRECDFPYFLGIFTSPQTTRNSPGPS